MTFVCLNNYEIHMIKGSKHQHFKLDWSMFLHFSRKYKITDGLVFKEDAMRQVVTNYIIFLRKKTNSIEGKCGHDGWKVLPK